MIADIGFITLLTAFLCAVYAIIAAAYGIRKKDDRWVRSARNAIIATFPLLLLAAGLIITALLTGDFSIRYVSSVSSRGMPTYLKVTALWGGQAGSLLFWNLLMSAFTATVMLSKWREQKELMPYVI
ncbi:MAG TPA: heme lyase CcmF/NrfE family subunit, partial [Promineifilum sp.]|nr:heme lyase CcmF/NrfE family subunit [Promineifilum sp.]